MSRPHKKPIVTIAPSGARRAARDTRRFILRIPGRMPVVKTRRQLKLYEDFYRAMIGSKNPKIRAKFKAMLLQILKETPSRASRIELVRLLRDSNLKVAERIDIAKFLEKKHKYKTLNLYTKLLFINDVPAGLRAHMVTSLGKTKAGFYIRAVRRAFKDSSQGKTVRRACHKALFKK